MGDFLDSLKGRKFLLKTASIEVTPRDPSVYFTDEEITSEDVFAELL